VAVNALSGQVEAEIAAHGLLRRGQTVLVAVSGGSDSMALLAVLRDLARRWRWRLVVAHFNHQFRGRASEADEALVRRTARQWGLACEVGRADVRSCAAASGGSLEMAGREARHAFLAAAARRRRARAVALAHHADDQVELFLVRLLRGASSLGLAGMPWSNPSPADSTVRLVRPFLGLTRAQLDNFVRQERIRFREDASNASHDILRNRIRHELLPLLARHYQPAVRTVILREMAALSADAGLIADLAQQWRQAPAEGSSRFIQLPLSVQRRLLQDELLGLECEGDFDRVEALRLRPGEPLTVGPGVQLRHDGAGRITRATSVETSFAGAREEIALNGSGGDGTFDGLTWTWKLSAARGKPPAFGAGCEWFDADQVGSGIVLRHWQPGDRFQPSGMSSPVKLQDLFTNRKVPRPQRHRLVVATTRTGAIWWVEGLRIGEGFKLSSRTRRRLRWSWRRSADRDAPHAPC
jgi:tRNA(Ile)-lysidine synthase